MKRVVALSVICGCAAAGFLLTRPAGEVAPTVTPTASTPLTDSARPNVGYLETRDHRIELKQADGTPFGRRMARSWQEM